mmetsp:Transcript_33791/g.105387  ORF Transcript_33791/g.105387 Transcript_33791/m.105387 type:complete len:186 (-) Transcript_33791:78-635(-)
MVSAQFRCPSALALDSDGWLLIADTRNHRIMRWPPGATMGEVFAGGNGEGSGLHQLHLPEGVAVDASGAVLIADTRNQRVLRWLPGSKTGEVCVGGDGAGHGFGQLDWPTRVSVDPSGLIFVADCQNHRVICSIPGTWVPKEKPEQPKLGPSAGSLGNNRVETTKAVRMFSKRRTTPKEGESVVE